MPLDLARDDPLAGGPALDAYLWKVSEPRVQWRKAQVGSGLAPLGCPEPSFFGAPCFPVQEVDGGIRDCDCVWVFGCRSSDEAIPSHFSRVA